MQTPPVSGALYLCERLLHQRPQHPGSRPGQNHHRRQLPPGVRIPGQSLIRRLEHR